MGVTFPDWTVIFRTSTPDPPSAALVSLPVSFTLGPRLRVERRPS